MRITVLYFASLREARAAESDAIELPAGARVADLLNLLRAGPLADDFSSAIKYSTELASLVQLEISLDEILTL